MTIFRPEKCCVYQSFWNAYAKKQTNICIWYRAGVDYVTAWLILLSKICAEKDKLMQITSKFTFHSFVKFTNLKAKKMVVYSVQQNTSVVTPHKSRSAI